MKSDAAVSVDVLVIGAGPGGLMTAHEAARRGASVLVAESNADVGGNAAFSTGYLAFADTSAQRTAGIADSAENFLEDMAQERVRKEAEYGPLAYDAELATRFALESGPTFERLLELGFRFGRFVSRPHQHTNDRTIVLQDPTQLRDVFVSSMAGLNVGVRVNHTAIELVAHAGAVKGAVLRRGDSEVEVHASSVVVATGGYQADMELCRRYRPEIPANAPFPGLASNRGQGHELMQAVGADLVNMHVVPEVVLIASRLVEDCIAVTEDGERFHDESGPERDRLTALRKQPGAIGYYICDARAAAEKAQLLADVPGGVKTVPTLEGVARMIGASPDALSETVARWNRIVDDGLDSDPDFGRVVFPDSRRGIVEPPFAVFPMVVGTNITGGGARTNAHLEVLNPQGDAIGNLYALGDCNGVLNPIAGMGGVHIAGALTLGRLVAQIVCA